MSPDCSRAPYNSRFPTEVYADTDAEDDLQTLVFGAPTDTVRALELFAGVLGGYEVNTTRMAERDAADFLTVTELADTLVRREGVSFREALAPSHFGRAFGASREELLKAPDPWAYCRRPKGRQEDRLQGRYVPHSISPKLTWP